METVAIEHVASAAERSIGELGQAAGPSGMKLRISIAIWNPVKKQYGLWRGQTWKTKVEGIPQANTIAETLRLFFEVASQNGWPTMLESMRAWADEFRK